MENGDEQQAQHTLRKDNFEKALKVNIQDKKTNLMFILKKLFTFLQICVLQTRGNISQKHSIDEKIL